MGVKILLHDEIQLLDWGESRSTGAWVKMRLKDPSLLDIFRGMDTATATKTGHILHLTLAEGDIAELAENGDTQISEKSDGKREPNRLAQVMHQKGYFLNPQLWKAVHQSLAYIQSEHRAFVISLPCLFCTDTPEDTPPFPVPIGAQKMTPQAAKEFYELFQAADLQKIAETPCQGDVVAHHCRTAATSGTGYKPDDWWTLPLCHAHHDAIHRHATKALNHVMASMAAGVAAWQMRRLMLGLLGKDHLSDVCPDDLREWEKGIEFEGMPSVYKAAER